jgi:hypothetical protein
VTRRLTVLPTRSRNAGAAIRCSLFETGILAPVVIGRFRYLRRVPAWQIVLAYTFATFLVVALFNGVRPAPLIINSVVFVLFLVLIYGLGRRQFWAILGCVFAASAVGLFIGHRLLGLPLLVREGLEVPIATGLTYLLVDRSRGSPTLALGVRTEPE